MLNTQTRRKQRIKSSLSWPSSPWLLVVGVVGDGGAATATAPYDADDDDNNGNDDFYVRLQRMSRVVGECVMCVVARLNAAARCCLASRA